MQDGKSEQGYRIMNKFAKQLLTDYQDKEKDDPHELARIFNLYKSLHSRVYDSDDIYTFNSAVVDEYLNLLMEHKRY